MSGLKEIYDSTDPKKDPGLNSNFEVDYVIDYKFPTNEEKAEAEAAFVQLIQALADVGFATEVRNGDADSLLIFIKIVSEKLLHNQVYRYRLQDWLYGIRTAAPDRDMVKHLEEEPITEAERLRLAYLLITKPKNEGGAGVAAKTGQYKYVDSIFPLHDHVFNKIWIKEWSTKYKLDDSDLDQIRHKFGEQVAFYFAFLQSYSTFLLFPAVFGFGAWMLLGQFSWFYAIVNSLWSVVFFEYWKVKEVDLAIQWGVRGVSKIQQPRPQFQFESEAQDPVTGEAVKIYSPWKRLRHQMLQVPFALACVAILGSLIAACFAVEIFITEMYNGPFKQYLTFVPTIILTALIPTLSTVLTGFAEKLTDLENYETEDAHKAALVQKIFVLNFLTSYLGIFLTAFVYVPFGRILAPYLDVFQIAVQRFTTEGKPAPTKKFDINPDRLTKQVIYFTVTAQIVNLALEVLVPYAKRVVFKTVNEVRTDFASNKKHELRYKDPEDEKAFLARVRNEAALEDYDVTTDYREMIVQFGYLSLFSVVWPLTGCSFLANNWVEARSDALKITVGSRRPIPWRADSIGPWLSSLAFLSWLGSLTSSALVYLFHNGRTGPDGSPSGLRAWALLVAMLLGEHIYLVVQRVVRSALGKMDRPGLQKERAERFAMRKNLLEETLGQDLTEEVSGPGVSRGENISRQALEEDARRESIHGGSREQAFWQRQRGAAESIQIGRSIIADVAAKRTKTTKK